MGYIAYFSDPQGMPRAWGKSATKEDAAAIAQIELETYRDKKRALGDPLGDGAFTLTVKEHPPKWNPALGITQGL
jgi:hypothetical protein